jgi:hypothetical protein
MSSSSADPKATPDTYRSQCHRGNQLSRSPHRSRRWFLGQWLYSTGSAFARYRVDDVSVTRRSVSHCRSIENVHQHPGFYPEPSYSCALFWQISLFPWESSHSPFSGQLWFTMRAAFHTESARVEKLRTLTVSVSVS